jgi:hypothetical protein
LERSLVADVPPTKAPIHCQWPGLTMCGWHGMDRLSGSGVQRPCFMAFSHGPLLYLVTGSYSPPVSGQASDPPGPIISLISGLASGPRRAHQSGDQSIGRPLPAGTGQITTAGRVHLGVWTHCLLTAPPPTITHSSECWRLLSSLFFSPTKSPLGVLPRRLASQRTPARHSSRVPSCLRAAAR